MNKKRIYLIIANKSEIKTITESNFRNAKIENDGVRKYYFLENENFEVVLVLSKVGLVNAALTMQALINRYQPKIVYNFGSVGAINKSDLYKVFIISHASYSDVETPLLPIGQLPEEPRDFKLFDQLKFPNKAKIASSNSFVWQFEKAIYISNLLGASLFDMETAAYAHVALQNRVAFASIKSASHIIDINKSFSNDSEYEKSVLIANKNAFKTLLDNVI